MTEFYRRDSNGHKIDWQPDDDDLAKQALENTPKTGVPDHAMIPEDAPVEVDNQTAKAIREEYQRLHIDKYGQESPYYDTQE